MKNYQKAIIFLPDGMADDRWNLPTLPAWTRLQPMA